MTSVKQAYPRAEWHATLLMGLLFHEVHETFAGEDWGGLRQSHFRVLSAVPGDGVSITVLAERLRMTKQGCGQLVTLLVESGHLRVSTDRADARVRRVRRTAKGERTNAAVRRRMLEMEEAWAARVGARRYATFRKVLEELAQPD